MANGIALQSQDQEPSDPPIDGAFTIRYSSMPAAYKQKCRMVHLSWLGMAAESICFYCSLCHRMRIKGVIQRIPQLCCSLAVESRPEYQIDGSGVSLILLLHEMLERILEIKAVLGHLLENHQTEHRWISVFFMCVVFEQNLSGGNYYNNSK